MDTLDYTSGKVNEGSKAIMLGLGEPVRKLPREYQGSLPAGVSRAEVFCGGCLVLQGGSYSEDESLASRVATDRQFGDWPLIVLHDDSSVVGFQMNLIVRDDMGNSSIGGGPNTFQLGAQASPRASAYTCISDHKQQAGTPAVPALALSALRVR